MACTTSAKMDARCPYKTNKDQGDGTAAPQASLWAPSAYLGGYRLGGTSREKKHSEKTTK